MQSEVMRKSRDHESLNSEGEALIRASGKDQNIVREQLDDIDRRWQRLSTGINEISDFIDIFT